MKKKVKDIKTVNQSSLIKKLRQRKKCKCFYSDGPLENKTQTIIRLTTPSCGLFPTIASN